MSDLKGIGGRLVSWVRGRFPRGRFPRGRFPRGRLSPRLSTLFLPILIWPRSTLTRRILALNLLALFIPVAGFLYLGEYRRDLIAAELRDLQAEAEILSAALGASAVTWNDEDDHLLVSRTATLLRRMVGPERRARLFGIDGTLRADSRLLTGPTGEIEVVPLPPPSRRPSWLELVFDAYDRTIDWLLPKTAPPLYTEQAIQAVSDYPEAESALAGYPATGLRSLANGRLVLIATAPVQRYKRVLASLMLTKSDQAIADAVRTVRWNILRVSALAVLVMVALSIYLAGTIARPMRHLAAAADQVRRSQGRLVGSREGASASAGLRQGGRDLRLALGRPATASPEAIPDFSGRGDEIGELSLALRAMTESLWLRMDAVGRFAADVAHEIKNPLTSLKSAVETLELLARGQAEAQGHRQEQTQEQGQGQGQEQGQEQGQADTGAKAQAQADNNPAQQQQRLVAIILDDIHRLDRLITDISAYSRLDGELSRQAREAIDIGGMLAMLVDMMQAASGPVGGGEARPPSLSLELWPSPEEDFSLFGVADHLMQVFRNLVANALSFSPPEGKVLLRVEASEAWLTVQVLDEGPGIPPGKLETIFERFYSARPAGEKYGLHSGLGLSISRQIVEAHGGSIIAQNRSQNRSQIGNGVPGGPAPNEPHLEPTSPSAPVTGACFTVRFPRA